MTPTTSHGAAQLNEWFPMPWRASTMIAAAAACKCREWIPTSDELVCSGGRPPRHLRSTGRNGEHRGSRTTAACFPALLLSGYDRGHLEKAQALTRAADNKGKWDSLTPLHAIVIEHIEPLKTFHPNVFPWENLRRTLDVEFAAIQDAPGIDLLCPDKQFPWHGKCTDACHRYGFHGEPYAFAMLNQGLDGPVLQALIRHKSYQTTLRYINAARQLIPAVRALHVPELSNSATP
jgi:hypothetical protein